MSDSLSGGIKPGRSRPRRRAPQTAARPSLDFPVVGIGASAGGLEATTKLMDAMPTASGMALILVQHLDPTHKSMMVDLLAGHTPLTVRQAADGMPIERDHLYVIPPGAYLSIGAGLLRLTAPTARHGARLPIDFLLQSLAKECGARAACIILSGTGADGSQGAKAIRQHAGLVIAQEPREAAYDGMPTSAIATGAVDLVLSVADMPKALLNRHRKSATPDGDGIAPVEPPLDGLPAILELVRTRTDHDFTHYKLGTLRRRIERRMAMASIKSDDLERYLTALRTDPTEIELLAKDLLINVTSFFRDPQVFKVLAEKTIPDLLRDLPADRQLRVWIAGCSTGEEAYSLALLIREQIAAVGKPTSGVRLQVFASDVDADAVAVARDGLYPSSIEAEMSPERLARFFIKDEHGYRVAPELRASVVFTVQDVLADPPFSRLDLVSCRNLLIYLSAEAQAKAISLFHFALREGGILLLGNSETIGDRQGRFEVISKPARLFRRVGGSRPTELRFAATDDAFRVWARSGRGDAPSRQSVLAALCSRVLLESYTPATIVTNHRHEYLHSVGPTERFLRVASGQPTNDLLAMVREDTRIRLRSAMQRAVKENARVTVPGGRTLLDSRSVPFAIVVEPVGNRDEELLLICFVDQPRSDQPSRDTGRPRDHSRVIELERELDASRAELSSAVRDLEISSQEQKAINEEAMSVNEEFQSTNEELLTSKEELQSLNEELTALNSQLQETLEQQRTTSNDLQNILYSTDVATLFLDLELKIRFFTPATKSLFNVIQGDVGRPLADLHSLAADGSLTADAREVLRSLEPIEREIEAPGDAWFRRRIMPYRTHDSGVEGVVIIFNDITKRKHAAKALELAKQHAESANTAKSRFLAAASHDLRQPLQTLSLLQGLLATTVQGDKATRLVGRLDDTLGALSGILNTLLDINQIEAGIVRAEMTTFPIGELLGRLNDEFAYHARAQGLSLRMVPCSVLIHTDPHLLEQMLRNLLSNALKYTKHGKVLLGCRRRGAVLSVEVWDTGIGIPDAELLSIFEEYHQVDNAARERSRGLGLGLSIVQRLGVLLQHRVRVQSRPGKGSVFAIEVPHPSAGARALPRPKTSGAEHAVVHRARRTGLLLVVEDDPEVRDLLELLLKQEGHDVTAVRHGAAALDLVTRDRIVPDLILSDYNLPDGMDGLEVTARLREHLPFGVPVIILTGDISAAASRAISQQNCLQLNKPVKPRELTLAVQQLLQPPQGPPEQSVKPLTSPKPGVIFVVDDDHDVRQAIRAVLEDDRQMVEDYAASETFLEAYRSGGEGCLLVDAYLPGMSGLELLQRLRAAGDRLPAIMITGSSDVSMAVRAMKAGASDFIEKPIGGPELLASVQRALEQSRDDSKLVAWQENAARLIGGLTIRQREIMDLVLAGHPSKNIAADLGVSQRTVENHRASIMKRSGANSLPALARLALAAASGGTHQAVRLPGGAGKIALPAAEK